MGAFRTTLEELRDADLLLHLVDASARDPEAQMNAVDAILTELALDTIPRVLVFNKCDRLPPDEADRLCRRFGAIGISALRPDTLRQLIQALEQRLHEVPSPWELSVAGAPSR
jgi:GTP-binding protein HflX